MDEDSVNQKVDDRLKEVFENIGIDISTPDARRTTYQDFLFLRNLRADKGQITQSFWKAVIDKTVQAIVTAFAVVGASLLSIFLSNHK